MQSNEIIEQKERDYNHWYYLNHKEELSIKKKKKYQKLRKSRKKYLAYLTKCLEYHRAHRERQNELSCIWEHTHKTRRNAYLRNKYNNDLIYKENYITYQKDWRSKNKDKVREYVRKVETKQKEMKMLNKII